MARHRLLDIGCGSLRLGCRAVRYLEPGHYYWGTDLSGALMARGYAEELAEKDRLPAAQLIEDGDFAFPGVPEGIDYAIAFGLFTHLHAAHLGRGLERVAACFPRLNWLLFTVFLPPVGTDPSAPRRQPDGVVTNPDRAPFLLFAGAQRKAGFESVSARPFYL